MPEEDSRGHAQRCGHEHAKVQDCQQVHGEESRLERQPRITACYQDDKDCRVESDPASR